MMNQNKSSWKLLGLAAFLPMIVLIAIDISQADEIHPESFKRFGNAILTSYVLMGIALMGNLFFYADSRHRPLAPLAGMAVAVGFGILISWTLVSYQDLLLEANSGLRAQMLSNIVHLIVSGTAMALASILAFGMTFAMITGRERRILFDEEE